MADSGIAHTETRESRAIADPRNVHGTLPDRILPGTQALYHLQSRIPRCSLPHLLQRYWQLLALEYKLRHSKMRQWLRFRRRV